MSTVLRLSDACSLAIHAAVLLAQSRATSLSVVAMASTLHVSEAHLAKVMQRLSKSALVKSTRGPRGGFALARPAASITLLQVFESVEGELTANGCLLGHPVCIGQSCVLGGLLQSLNEQVKTYLGSTTIAAMAEEGYGDPAPAITQPA